MDTSSFGLADIARPAARVPHDCESCAMSRLCHPASDPPPTAPYSYGRRRVRRGEAAYRAGDPLSNLYQLRAGSMKIRITNPSGVEQITAFPIAGALLGLDAIETGTHASDAIALEDSEVCVLPYAQLMAHCSHDPAAAHLLHQCIAHDINQCHRLLLTLGRMTTEVRIAGFMVDLSEQMAAQGYSPREFVLKMTREDIANHLGMQIETVCRVFSRLQSAALIQVTKRHLEILDVEALRRMRCG
ncbi:fumarate/nitrate reduction transcriptional regulator [Streptomyces cavourensis]|jgi:CRP/FNR family transcriptional regulator|nr:fumarate/nitrate reduction transcriptional regulator [Streptomyces cavourensis]